MKPTYNAFLTKETKKKLVSVDTNLHPEKTYTKSDFLSSAKLGTKYGIDTKEAEEILKKLNFKRAVFSLNGRKAPVTIRTISSSHRLFLHPMATAIFEEQLNKKAK